MSMINVSNLTFVYDGSYVNVFDNCSFVIDTDWKLGLIGRNGRGKTTFLKLLLGQYNYSGSIQSNVKFEYFPYEVVDDSIDTIDVVYSICPDVQEWEVLKELPKIHLDENVLYRQFSTLSKGEQTKILLVALFLVSNSFLLIDEPTNHLDIVARGNIVDYLKKKKGFIIVSHDKNLLDNCVNHIVSINKNNIQVQKGNFSTWWQNKQYEDNFEIVQNEKLKKDISRLSEATKRTANWSDAVEATKIGSGAGDRGRIGHKAAKMMKRSKSIQNRREKAVEDKSKLLKNIEQAEKLELVVLPYKGNMVEFKDVSIMYDEKKVCDNVSFEINAGDRICVKGQNGSGKSSLLKLLCGEDISYTGIIYKNKDVEISYISQSTDYLKGGLIEFANDSGVEVSLFFAMLHKLDFDNIDLEKNIETLSLGQKKKVIIAKSLCDRSNLYVWDEPLNYIDIYSRMQIEDLIMEYKPTLVFVEHDEEFCNAIATKVVEL